MQAAKISGDAAEEVLVQLENFAIGKSTSRLQRKTQNAVQPDSTNFSGAPGPRVVAKIGVAYPLENNRGSLHIVKCRMGERFTRDISASKSRQWIPIFIQQCFPK